MGTTRSQWQRTLKLVPRTGESLITNFLRWTEIEELWVITPAMWLELPEPLKTEYRFISSCEGLLVCYDRVPDNIRPMLEVLLRRWHLTEPAKVAQALDAWRQFLLRRRWLLPQLEQARARGLAEEALLALYDRLCADYDRRRVHGRHIFPVPQKVL